MDLGHCIDELKCRRYSSMCHSEGKKPIHLDVAPFEDVMVWIDPISLDDDYVPLWRCHEAIIHHEVTLGSWDVVHMMMTSCLSEV
jgi:hypothetical protein